MASQNVAYITLETVPWSADGQPPYTAMVQATGMVVAPDGSVVMVGGDASPTPVFQVTVPFAGLRNRRDLKAAIAARVATGYSMPGWSEDIVFLPDEF